MWYVKLRQVQYSSGVKSFIEKTPEAQKRFDLILAAGLIVLTWAQLFIAWFAAEDTVLGGGMIAVTGFHQRSIIVTLVLATLCFLPLIWRRQRPILVLALVTVAQCAMTLWTLDPLPTFIAPLIALYTVGTLQSTRKLVIASVLVAVALMAANQLVPAPVDGRSEVLQRQSSRSESIDGRRSAEGSRGGERSRDGRDGRDGRGSRREAPPAVIDFVNISRGQAFSNVLQVLALVVAFAALGRMTRLHRENIIESEARLAETQRASAEESRRRTEQERLAIARELHDITAHSLAAVIVQAGAAETQIKSGHNAEAQQSVTALRNTAKQSLGELRHAVSVLREGGAESDVPLSPEVSLRNLDALLQSFSAAGLPVSYENRQAGDRFTIDTLPTTVDVAAYRIIQESLTNALRHSVKPSFVHLQLGVSDTELKLNVENDGVKSIENAAECVHSSILAGGAAGHGIEGMRERVCALGGSFEAGAEADDGLFKVKARIPLR